MSNPLIRDLPGLDPLTREKLSKILQAQLEMFVKTLNEGSGRTDLYFRALQILDALESKTK